MPTDLQQARKANPETPDEELVIELAASIIDEVDLEPPIPLEVIAALRGVDRVEHAEMDVAACLITHNSSSVIKLRSSDSRSRQMFSGFHEIGHTFFEGYQLRIQFRCNPLLDRDPVEVLCDQAASELIMPRKFFVPDVEASSFTIASARDLKDRYNSSLEATAIQMSKIASGESFLLRMEVRNKPRDLPGAAPCLRASGFVPSTVTRALIPTHKSLNANDPLQEVMVNGTFNGLTRLNGLTDGATLYRVDAELAPWLDKSTGELRQRVLALVEPVTSARGPRV